MDLLDLAQQISQAHAALGPGATRSTDKFILRNRVVDLEHVVIEWIESIYGRPRALPSSTEKSIRKCSNDINDLRRYEKAGLKRQEFPHERVREFQGKLEHYMLLFRADTDGYRNAFPPEAQESFKKCTEKHNRGYDYLQAFNARGEFPDLHKSLELCRSAVEHALPYHPERQLFLNTLGMALERLAEITNSMEHIDESVQVLKESVSYLPPKHPAMALCSTNLAKSLHIRFQMKGSTQDLQEAIELVQKADQETPQTDPVKRRYERQLEAYLGHMEVRNQAMKVQKQTKNAISSLTAGLKLRSVSRIYGRLQGGSLRLLEILDDSGLRCEIAEYSINNAPPYIALSYTWKVLDCISGPPTARFTLILNGHHVSLQQNLFDALRYLGHEVRARRCKLWVDFLCINQSDDAERATQVQRMKDIYQGATEVFSWLGIPDNERGARLGVSLMNHAVNHLLSDKGYVVDPTMLEETRAAAAQGLFASSLHDWKSDEDLAWSGLFEMFNRPYWQRTWVHQEITARTPVTIFCGRHSFTRAHVQDTCKWSEQLSSERADDIGYNCRAYAVLQNSVKTLRLPNAERPLLSVVQDLRWTECKDPRDKLYAAISHATDLHDGQLRVDYEKDVAELYFDFASMALAKYGLQFLGQVNFPVHEPVRKYKDEQLEPIVPSWVPDWRVEHKFLPLLASTTKLYNPVPDTAMDATISGKCLRLSGITFDRVSMLSSAWLDGKRNFKEPKNWKQELRKQGATLSDHNFDRTVVGDVTTTINEDILYDIQRGAYADWSLLERMHIYTREDGLRKELLFRDLMHFSWGRRAGVTERGCLGLFPATAKVGDKLVAFYGGQVLYVIRPLSGNARHQFVGECYVDEMMDGQVLQLASKCGISTSNIVLV